LQTEKVSYRENDQPRIGVNPKALISMNHLNIQKMSEREFSI
jgi:hypothetical protein